jgi:hypothetical protein
MVTTALLAETGSISKSNEKSHRIFMAYLFIGFQQNSVLMSTKYSQYLLKILSVTLSAQVKPCVSNNSRSRTTILDMCRIVVAAATNQS